MNIAGDINAGASLRLASAFYGNKLTQDQFNALDVSTVRYVAVYTEDTTNPYGYVDESYPYDINGDGSPDLIAGGVVINPSQLNIEYVDSQGNPLHAVERRTGPSLTDYLMTSNTDGIQAGEYYKNNQQLLLSPVAVDGYVAPADKTITLAIDDNTIRFVYYTEAEVLAMQTPTPSVTKSTADTIVVVWSPTEGAVGYTVQYRVKGASEWISGSVSISADTLMYTMYGLALNTEYETQVIAHQADGASIASPVLSARTNSELSDTGVDATQAILTGSVVAFVGMIVLMYRKKLVS